MNDNPWIENTGTVPEGVGPDTVIEVEYRDGIIGTWLGSSEMIASNDPDLWGIDEENLGVIRWRFV